MLTRMRINFQSLLAPTKYASRPESRRAHVLGWIQVTLIVLLIALVGIISKDDLKQMDAQTDALVKAEVKLRAEEFTFERITTSIGVAVYPTHGATIAEVLKKADAALYEAKRAGRDQVMLADDRN